MAVPPAPVNGRKDGDDECEGVRANRVNVFGPGAFVSLAVLVAGPVPAAALQQPQRFELKAVHAAKPPVIDGAVDEEEWRGATVASDFVQFEPRRGAPSTAKTEVLVLYDAGHLYVAFRAWDPEPLTAQLTQRDADLFGDDSVIVLLDSSSRRIFSCACSSGPIPPSTAGTCRRSPETSRGSPPSPHRG